jgi:hypothetical protein
MQRDPGMARRMAEIERFAHARAAQAGALRNTDTILTIPVVVHVVYNTPTQNLPDAIVESQIEVLNETFRLQNADTSAIPGPFKPVAADTRIEFCLARFDPDGNPTNGITRTQTSKTFFPDDSVKFNAGGGHDAWPYESYLNIWVAPISPGLLGYASSIGGGGDPQLDGVVIGWEYFGNPSPDPAFNLGRTATHEVGHWLGLRHIWSDDNDCSTDDGIADTPPQLDPNYGCKTFPSISCNNGPNGDMFVNHMDYSDDACLLMFTANQRDVMRAILSAGGSRYSIRKSVGCLNPDFNDAGITAILSPGPEICGGDFEAKARMRNFGTNALTQAEVEFYMDGSLSATFPWTGTLGSNQQAIISQSFFNLPAGPHQLIVKTASPNNSLDPVQANNADTLDFVVLDNQGIAAPYAEGLEGAAFPPAGWQLVNPDALTGWQRTSSASYAGSASVFMDNFNYASVGAADEFLLPDVDISAFSQPQLSFWVAYAQFGANTGFADTLEVWLSSDCGITYKRYYQKFGASLATRSPLGGPFVPAGAGEWRKESISLSDFAGSTGLSVRFRAINNYENNLYVDNINLEQSVVLSLPGLERSARLYPQPAQGQLWLHWEGSLRPAAALSLQDLAGRALRQYQVSLIPGEAQALDVRGLPAGLYFLRIGGSEAALRVQLD